MSDISNYPGETVKALKKIDPSDLKFNPMQLNKTFNMYSGSTDYHTPLQAYYTNTVTQNYTSGEQNADDSYKTIIYKSIDQLFYKYATDNELILFQTSSIFSIPQKKMGQKIKKDSFTYSSASLNLASYRTGKIYDSNMVTSSFPDGISFYEGFNEYFNTEKIKYVHENVTYVSGVTTDNGDQQPVGLSSLFSGDGYIETYADGAFNRDNEYAISFFISGTNSTNLNELIISKKFDNTTAQYPFNIELSGSNQLIFNVGATDLLQAQVTSSTDVSSSWTHVVCQKTGSDIELYINGTIHASGSFNFLRSNFNEYRNSPVNISNTSSLKIGGYTGSNHLEGYLDEIRIYNKGLTTAEISTLSDRNEGGGMLQTNIVGNIFAEKGFAVISTPDYRFNNLITSAYTASYKSTVTLYEMSSLCRIDAGDFNVTSNYSALTEDNTKYLNYLTGSNFSPYITNIGLYNSTGELLAIAKLGQPIKKRNDVDMNFLVRLDLDTKPNKFLTDSENEISADQTTVINQSNIKDNVSGQTSATLVSRTSAGGGGY